MKPIINPEKFGVSFSASQCKDLGLDTAECLDWALRQGFRRFRLMSYWNAIEKQPGQYNFSDLDSQIAQITKVEGVISLCLGVKQPRWPEYHWPHWALNLEISQKNDALLKFIEIVVNRYKNNKNIISWQLENEALLKGFGEHIAVDRKRIKQEYQLVQSLDDSRPIIMSTSNGWGLPVRKPIPDVIGFSYYGVMHQNGKYRKTIHKPWLYKIRRYLTNQLLSKPSYIHELQLEPWGPKAIWEMPLPEQDKSMSVRQISKNIADAKKINAYPIDLWGVEWWYWRVKQGDELVWNTVKNEINR